jgi:RNA polymerase sigma-70 factor (ECF subfamily)
MDDPVASSYRRHFEDVHRFVNRRVSPDDAEDVTQEVFASAIEALATARLEADPPLAWLYTVARRRLVDLARRRRLELIPIDAEGVHLEERTYGPRVAKHLLAAVERLSEDRRRVVVLKLFRGCSFGEIAALIDCSEEACKMRFYRGLSDLRDELERKGVDQK